MNLLLFNLATDADDPILAFTTAWLNRLAQHYEHIDVITMRSGRLATAPNVRVYSLGKEHGASEARRLLRFYAVLFRLLRQRRYGACFAHMQPLFALLAWPVLAALRVPVTLWYVHRSRHWMVRFGRFAARRVVSSTRDSFPFPTPKLRVVGHGVDTGFFRPGGTPAPETLVYVARLSAVKHHDTLLRAAQHTPGLRLVIVGGVPAGEGPAYLHGLQRTAEALGISGRVAFAGPQPPEGVRAACQQAALSVNLSPRGLYDKSALEAMACGVPTICSNPAFAPVLGEDAPRLLIPSETDHAALAERIQALLALPEAERAAIGLRLREAVVRTNSLDVLIPRLVSVINTGELAEERE